VNDPYNLQRFVAAQDQAIDRVLEELGRGRKSSHWMWFLFPQIAGLGHSAMARKFALSSLGEARAFLAHPLLGPRLRQCTQLVLDARNRSAHDIFGSPDDIKFRSSMTLFASAAPEETVFRAALDKYFGGEADEMTLEKIGAVRGCFLPVTPDC
jgi:uncharacterized protein (DUF1810 family)